MSGSLPLIPSREEVCARYRVEVLLEGRAARDGLFHWHDGSEQVLPWTGVIRVFAAEVGEPQGIRTVVFDLVVAEADGFSVCRFDAEPGDPAIAAARNLTECIPAERLGASVKSLAAEGIAVDWYPDVETFEEAALGALET
ncbi:MAG: hypothetical protein QNK04_29725 [Myxococcota bacterium]|nr:hypothetical protein [Myxococcota bacterium]